MPTLQPATPNRDRTFVSQVLAVFLPMALLTCGAAYYFYHGMQDRVAIHSRSREAAGIELGQNAINNVLLEIRRDLRLVSENYALKDFLDQPMPGEIRDFEQDMLNLASSSRCYDQIRWLDESGMERVRVNFNNGKPVITPAPALQNQRARYDFLAAFKLARGEATISPLDLNIEHDRIEIPHKPILRIATPVFDSHGNKRGIVLLNYFGAKLLARFDKATANIADHAMLLNQDGYWLKSPRADEAWGFMFGRDQLTLARRHPAAWQRILAADSGQFENADGLWTFNTIYPAQESQKTPGHNALADRVPFWKVVAHLPPTALYGSHPSLKPMLAALAALLLLQFIGSWKLARARRLRNEAQEQMQHTNRNLERLVEERTAQLQADITMRKQAEVALRQSKEQLKISIQAGNIGLWDWDLRTNWVFFSPKWKSQIGYEDHEIGKGFTEWESRVHPDDLERTLQAVRSFIDKPSLGYSVEFRFRHKDGSYRWILAQASLLYGDQGQPVRMLGSHIDITGRKQVEETLREKERMLSESQRIAHVGSWQLVLPAGNMTWSDETYLIYGVSPETFALDLASFYALIHADDLTSVREWARACRVGEHPGGLEFRAVRPDGNVRVISGCGDMQYDAENRPMRMIGTVQDITEHKRVEQNLVESERLLNTIIESEPECVKLLDAKNRLLRMNSAGLNLIEADSGDQVIGENVLEVVAPEHRDAFAALTRRVFAGESGELEFEIIGLKGTRRWMGTHAVPLRDIRGGINAYLGITRDITERKRAEEKLLTLSTAVEQAPISVVITDLEANIQYVNPRFTEITGYGADEVIGQNPRFLQSTLTPKETYRDMWNTLTDGRVWHGELINARKNGETYWEDAHIAPVINAAGAITHYVGVKLDVTGRKQAEERLRQAAAVFESTREGVIVTDVEQRILRVNPAFCVLTGYTEAEALGQRPSLLSSGRQGRDFYAGMWASLNLDGHWQGEIWNRRKNGEVYPELLSISAIKDDSGQVTGYVGVFADTSTLKASQSELEFLAHHDPLTRLPNRLLLFSRLEHGIELAQRENRQLALLMFDLDRFKDVNDSFGHLAGDELLQQVGGRLTSRLRNVDTVCRLGGDEFTVIVLLEDITRPEDAGRVADEIIVALSEPWQLANGEVRIGASVGISLFPQHGNSAAELLQQADAALYHAKAEGRGRFMYFSENLTRAARERIRLEARLRRAIAQDELRVFYQPQVDIASGRIIGAEALVRWQDPLEGLIPPARFIPVAEATGLISAVGEWVLKETCLQGQRWIEAGLPPLTLAVNVSAHQFLRGDLVEVVSRTLAATGFPAAWLELELTESALMGQQQEAVDMLNRLRAIGVRLAIDDFGTGYSSLAYLKRFPLDVLKIDKSFVDDIPDSQDDREIAATIVAMGHTLRFKVLAEGVETVEQLAFLQAQGCDSYQGYLKSPPLPPDAFAELLAESRLE